MGAMAACGALCYGELAARFPEAGGGYVYLREAYGPMPAFLYGWMALLVMDPGLTAALAVGMSGYVAYIFRLSPGTVKIVAIVAIFLLAFINVRGVRPGASLLQWVTLLKVGLLALLLFWGFGRQLGDWSNFVPFVAQRANSAPLLGALAGGMVAAFFSFGGWWDVTKLAGEIKEPARILPRALIYGVSTVTLIYILTSALFIYLVPIAAVTSGDTFAAQAGEVLFGKAGGEIFALVVIVAVFGSLAAVIMSASRVYFAMARDGLFFNAAAAIHPRFETPARAILIQATLASVLVIAGNFYQIISYFIFVVVIFLALTIAALFVARKPETANGYRTPWYPFAPLFFLVLTVLLLFLIASSNPKESLLGVVVVAAGIPVYQLFFRKK